MRVGLLIDRWEPSRGGAERALAQLAAHLERGGHQALALCRRGPQPGEYQPAGGVVRVRAGGLFRGARERRLGKALVEAAERLSDVTVGVRHLPRADLYWPHGGCHRETLRVLGKKPRGRHRVFLEFEDRLLSGGGARRIACVSSLVREEILRHHPSCAERLELVPNGVDLERFRVEARGEARAALEEEGIASPGRPLIAFVGGNPILKGLPILLEALWGLRHLEWRLVVAGVRNPTGWRLRARAFGIGERTAVRRRLPALELAAGADLVCLPTRRDPAPLAVLEALACGTPVITTERAGTAEAIVEPLAGVVLPAEPDRLTLAAALEERLARLPSGDDERRRIRATVAERGLGPWLGRLTALLEGLAP